MSPGGLLLWRPPQATAWTEADHPLGACAALLLGRLAGAETAQPGIDRLTGLPNRRWFLDEADRRAERLDHDDAVASLLLIDIDHLRRVNFNCGCGQGDRVLVRLASQLRAMVRPGDLVARVGSDEFAVWQDGMDHLTAAERADALCATRPSRSAPDDPVVALSVGIVVRLPAGTEDVHSLLRRAYDAAQQVKLGGGGSWRVSHAAPAQGRSRGNE